MFKNAQIKCQKLTCMVQKVAYCIVQTRGRILKKCAADCMPPICARSELSARSVGRASNPEVGCGGISTLSYIRVDDRRAAVHTV